MSYEIINEVSNNEQIISLFDSLSYVKQTKDRANILDSILNGTFEKEILSILSWLKYDQFMKKVRNSMIVSWAWMIKIRLFEHRNWAIRYHIFNKDLNNKILNNHWEDPHVHDFQAYSRVVLGEVMESRFNISIPNSNVIQGYKLFLDQFNQWEYFESDNKHISWNNFHNLYTFFSENRNEVNWIDSFKKLWVYQLDSMKVRNIKQNEKYFLDSSIAHSIWIKDDSATICVMDKTFKYWNKVGCHSNKKILRWHWVRIPQNQKKSIERKNENYWLDSKKLFELCKTTSLRALSTMS